MQCRIAHGDSPRLLDYFSHRLWLLGRTAFGTRAINIAGAAKSASHTAGRRCAGQRRLTQPQPLLVAPPFRLSPQEQADLDGLLKAWEQQSQGVKYFKCTFNRLEYNPAFANGNPNQLTTESHGEIKFAAPDKGMFRVLNMFNFVQDPKTQKYKKQPIQPTEWWTCDGKSMFQVDAAKKEVVETPLPPNMQGTAIADGPLPFVFGAKAEALKKRYLMATLRRRRMLPKRFGSTCDPCSRRMLPTSPKSN